MGNVLVTSCGRRVSLVRAFAAACADRGDQVFGADADPLAPALHFADRAFRLPLVSRDDYISSLVEIIRAHDIRLVVPTIDPELQVLAADAARLTDEGCRALVSSPSFVRTSGDKWLTQEVYSGHGLRGPKSWLPQTVEPGDLPERLFVKPRQGSSSIGAQKVSRARLDEAVGQLTDPIIQEELDGQEITIDALIDVDGRPLHYVPRVRLRTLAGESIQGVTIDDGPIRNWLLLLLETSASLGARGPVTFQAFLTQRGPVLIEVNARFGGGFPLALAAGAEYPRWILSSLRGERVPPRLGDYERGLHMSRYHVELFTTRPAW